MSTRVRNPVVPTPTPPSMAVHPAGTGTEVTGPVPVDGVPAPGPATTAAAPVSEASQAMDAFGAALDPMIQAFQTHLRRPEAGVRINSATANHQAAAPLLSSLAQDHTDLAGVGDSATIDRGVATLAASQRLAATLKLLLAQVLDTGRMDFNDGWKQAGAVLVIASRLARKDKDMADALAPVQAILRRGPAPKAAARVATRAQQKAANAQTRATVAHQRAASATTAAVHTAAAHAARHPTPGTSPVPLANPQGPAASADVAPQGPAPVPGTGR